MKKMNHWRKIEECKKKTRKKSHILSFFAFCAFVVIFLRCVFSQIKVLG
jgi:hypothetical protein